jgi:disulfide bond formation protein DsbB
MAIKTFGRHNFCRKASSGSVAANAFSNYTLPTTSLPHLPSPTNQRTRNPCSEEAFHLLQRVALVVMVVVVVVVVVVVIVCLVLRS